MCSPDENWSPIQIPSKHRSEPLHWTGNPMHDGGTKGIHLARVGFAGEIFPGGVVPLPDLESVQEVTGVLKQPWEEVVVHRQFFPTSLLKINKQGPQHLFNSMYGHFRLSIAFRVAASSVCEHGPRLASFSGNPFEQVRDGRFLVHPHFEAAVMSHPTEVAEDLLMACLLYTSDAADE